MYCHYIKNRIKIFFYLFSYLIIFSCSNNKKSENKEPKKYRVKFSKAGKLHFHPLKIFSKISRAFKHKKRQPQIKHAAREVALARFKVRFNRYGIDFIRYNNHPYAMRVQKSAHDVKQSATELVHHPFHTARKAARYLELFSLLLRKHNFSTPIIRRLTQKFKSDLTTFRDFLRELVQMDGSDHEYRGMMNYSYSMMDPKYNLHHNANNNIGMNHKKPHRPLPQNLGAELFKNIRFQLRQINLSRQFINSIHGITRQTDTYINELDSQIRSFHDKYQYQLKENDNEKRRYRRDIMIDNNKDLYDVRKNDSEFELRRILNEYRSEVKKIIREKKFQHRDIRMRDNIRRNNEHYMHKLNNGAAQLRIEYNRINNHYLQKVERTFSRSPRADEAEAKVKFHHAAKEMKNRVEQSIHQLRDSSNNYAHFDRNNYHHNVRRVENRLRDLQHERNQFHNRIGLLNEYSRIPSSHLDPVLHHFGRLKEDLNNIYSQYSNNYETRNSFNTEIGNDANSETEKIMIDMIHSLKKHYMKLFRNIKRNNQMMNQRKIEELTNYKTDFNRHVSHIMQHAHSRDIRANVHRETKDMKKHLHLKYNREIEYLRHGNKIDSLVQNYHGRFQNLRTKAHGMNHQQASYMYGNELNNFNRDLENEFRSRPQMRDRFNNHDSVNEIRNRFNNYRNQHQTQGYYDDCISEDCDEFE